MRGVKRRSNPETITNRLDCFASLAMTIFLSVRASPRTESRRAEQRLLRRGLRAPVLRRRFDLAAEFGGGVPAPARVVEHGARQRDHVGLAGRDNIFGL